MAFVVVFCYLEVVLYELDSSDVRVSEPDYVFLWSIRCFGYCPLLVKITVLMLFLCDINFIGVC